MTTTNFGIKKTFNENDFINEFKAYNRMDNFSYHGLTVLFESLDEMAQDCEMDIEMDVIALCCEYNESSVNDVINDYSIDVSSCENDDEIMEFVKKYLREHTMLLGAYYVGNIQHFLYQAF